MNTNQILAQRYYKFFKYLRLLAVIGLVLFLGVTAFNTGNQTLTTISYILLIATLACLMECIVTYVLYRVFKRKS